MPNHLILTDSSTAAAKNFTEHIEKEPYFSALLQDLKAKYSKERVQGWEMVPVDTATESDEVLFMQMMARLRALGEKPQDDVDLQTERKYREQYLKDIQNIADKLKKDLDTYTSSHRKEADKYEPEFQKIKRMADVAQEALDVVELMTPSANTEEIQETRQANNSLKSAAAEYDKKRKELEKLAADFDKGVRPQVQNAAIMNYVPYGDEIIIEGDKYRELNDELASWLAKERDKVQKPNDEIIEAENKSLENTEKEYNEALNSVASEEHELNEAWNRQKAELEEKVRQTEKYIADNDPSKKKSIFDSSVNDQEYIIKLGELSGEIHTIEIDDDDLKFGFAQENDWRRDSGEDDEKAIKSLETVVSKAASLQTAAEEEIRAADKAAALSAEEERNLKNELEGLGKKRDTLTSMASVNVYTQKLPASDVLADQDGKEALENMRSILSSKDTVALRSGLNSFKQDIASQAQKMNAAGEQLEKMDGSAVSAASKIQKISFSDDEAENLNESLYDGEAEEAEENEIPGLRKSVDLSDEAIKRINEENEIKEVEIKEAAEDRKIEEEKPGAESAGLQAKGEQLKAVSADAALLYDELFVDKQAPQVGTFRRFFSGGGKDRSANRTILGDYPFPADSFKRLTEGNYKDAQTLDDDMKMLRSFGEGNAIDLLGEELTTKAKTAADKDAAANFIRSCKKLSEDIRHIQGERTSEELEIDEKIALGRSLFPSEVLQRMSNGEYELPKDAEKMRTDAASILGFRAGTLTNTEDKGISLDDYVNALIEKAKNRKDIKEYTKALKTYKDSYETLCEKIQNGMEEKQLFSKLKENNVLLDTYYKTVNTSVKTQLEAIELRETEINNKLSSTVKKEDLDKRKKLNGFKREYMAVTQKLAQNLLKNHERNKAYSEAITENVRLKKELEKAEREFKEKLAALANRKADAEKKRSDAAEQSKNKIDEAQQKIAEIQKKFEVKFDAVNELKGYNEKFTTAKKEFVEAAQKLKAADQVPKKAYEAERKKINDQRIKNFASLQKQVEKLYKELDDAKKGFGLSDNETFRKLKLSLDTYKSKLDLLVHPEHYVNNPKSQTFNDYTKSALEKQKRAAQLKEEIDELNKTANERQKNVDAYNEKIANLKDKLNSYQEEIAEQQKLGSEKFVELLRKEADDCKKEINKLEKDLKDALEVNNSLLEKLADRQDNLQAAKEASKEKENVYSNLLINSLDEDDPYFSRSVAEKDITKRKIISTKNLKEMSGEVTRLLNAYVSEKSGGESRVAGTSWGKKRMDAVNSLRRIITTATDTAEELETAYESVPKPDSLENKVQIENKYELDLLDKNNTVFSSVNDSLRNELNNKQKLIDQAHKEKQAKIKAMKQPPEEKIKQGEAVQSYAQFKAYVEQKLEANMPKGYNNPDAKIELFDKEGNLDQRIGVQLAWYALCSRMLSDPENKKPEAVQSRADAIKNFKGNLEGLYGSEELKELKKYAEGQKSQGVTFKKLADHLTEHNPKIESKRKIKA